MDANIPKLQILSNCDPGKVFYYEGRKHMITHVLSRKYKMFIVINKDGTYRMRISSDYKQAYYDALIFNSEETKPILESSTSVSEDSKYKLCDSKCCHCECSSCAYCAYPGSMRFKSEYEMFLESLNKGMAVKELIDKYSKYLDNEANQTKR